MLNQDEVNNLFQVFLENCSNELLRQTIRYNPEPEAVKAAQLVLEYRKSKDVIHGR